MADPKKIGLQFAKVMQQASQEADAALAASKALPKVDRLSMSYKDVTKRVPEVADAVERLFKGEITKQQYNDIVNTFKPVTPYSFVPKPATPEEAIGALRGEAAKSKYGKQVEYEPGSKVGLRLDIPAYTDKGVWVNSIHDEKAKKVAYGPVASVKNANLGISQNESKRIALGGSKAPYAKIKGDWNPMSEEEAVAKAQQYLNDPEWRQIGMDPERHSYFYDRHTMQPIIGADEVIQIGPLVLGKNPKYGKIEDFEYADGGKIIRGALNAINKASKISDEMIAGRQLNRTFKTTDGYTFREMPSGEITNGDMSWPSAKEFMRDMPHSWREGDELGKRRAMIESYGRPDPENMLQELSKFMPPNDPQAAFQRALNEQRSKGTLRYTKGEDKNQLRLVPPEKRRGGLIRFGKGGKANVGLSIANAVSKASKEADAILAAEKAAKETGKLEEALKAKQAPMTTPQGTGLPLMPRDQGMYTPREQKDLPRMPGVDKARAKGETPKYTPRMQDLLDSPTARKKVNTLIEKGEELGMREWYGTEPLRQVAMDIGMSPKQFEQFMAQMASASQRNPVDQQNRMGSYLHYLSQTGQLPEDAFLLTNKIKRGKEARPEGTAIELPPGYGSLAQGDIFSRGKQIAAGDIAGALPPERKLGTFYENLLGNLKPVTVDVNAVRGPIIERGDPRWLASKLVEKDEEGNVIATHFPRRDVQSGLMSMKQAKERPGFWEAAPSGSEYAGFEDLWQRAAKRKGVDPAEAQALGWYGSADVTALKTKPELYIENLERMIRRTAEQTGQNPRVVMEDVLRGKQYLKKKGGAVERISAFKDPKEARRWKDEIATEMNKANGGAIKKLSFRNTPAMKMAQGGQPSLGPVTDNTRPDPSDSGRIQYAPKFARGGMAGGGSPEEMLTPPGETEKGKARLMMEILARMAKEQGVQEIESLKKPRAATDILNKGLVAGVAGIPVDMMNMGLEGIDFLRSKATGKPVENRLASDKPFLGSEHLKDLMKQYGMVTDEERPMMETAMSIMSPGAALKGAVGAAQAAPKAARAVEGGLNAATAAVARPFTPATVTMEAVAPDLAKFKPRQWQETATRRMTGPGAPVSMETLGGRQTTKRPAQGVYLNDPDEFGVRQLETNPMVAVDVPRAGSLAANKPFRKDVSQAGMELGQESVAAHRFLPMATQNIADASSMLIKPKKGAISNEEVAALGRELPHMIVAHNPRLGGVVIAPFELKPGQVPSEFFDAQEVAGRVLGNRAKFTYGKTDPAKDLMYIPRSDYVKEGATTPSPASKAMRERLKKAEGRLFRQSVPATAETP